MRAGWTIEVPEEVSAMPGRKYRSIKAPKIYEALRRRGLPKSRAAAISNAAAKKRGGKSKKKS